MTTTRHKKRSELFLLRVWREEDKDGTPLWCGRLQHTISGEQHQFRTFGGLAVLLEDLLDAPSNNNAAAPKAEEAATEAPNPET